MPYDPRMIQPFRDELTQAGVVQGPARGGQRAGADLDDKSLGGAQISVTGREHP